VLSVRITNLEFLLLFPVLARAFNSSASRGLNKNLVLAAGVGVGAPLVARFRLTLLASCALRLASLIENQGFQIRHSKRASSVSAQACVWLVDCLLVPPDELAPYEGGVILFRARIDHRVLVNDIQSGLVGVRIVAHVTLANPYLLPFALCVVGRCEVGPSPGYQKQGVTERGDLDLL
jgi:hypothetical protein